ncbi:MAG: hypothetical protein ACLPX5_04225 [Dissulfurispiraceae bacterium]
MAELVFTKGCVEQHIPFGFFPMTPLEALGISGASLFIAIVTVSFVLSLLHIISHTNCIVTAQSDAERPGTCALRLVKTADEIDKSVIMAYYLH